jgi:flagella basal body P-ring formation protein FlgA
MISRLVIALALGGAVIFSGAAHASTTITLDKTATAAAFVRFADLGEIAGDNAALIKRQFVAPLTPDGAVFTRPELTRRLQILGLEQGVIFKGSDRVTVFYDAAAPEPTVAAPELATAWRSETRRDGAGTSAAPQAIAGTGKTTAQPAIHRTPGRAERRPTPGLARESEMLLQAALEVLLRQEFADFSSRANITVRKASFAATEFAAVEISGIREGKIPGRVVVDVVLKDAAEKILDYGIAELYAEVELETPILARSLNLGDVIRASDVAMQYKKFTGARPEKFQLPELVGRECKRALRVGSPISLADFTPPPAVRKGDAVVVTVRGAGFSVDERTLAMTGGQVGECITVQSNSVDEKGKPLTYLARLTGPYTATLVRR